MFAFILLRSIDKTYLQNKLMNTYYTLHIRYFKEGKMFGFILLVFIVSGIFKNMFTNVYIKKKFNNKNKQFFFLIYLSQHRKIKIKKNYFL